MGKWKERHFSQAALGTYQVCPLRFRYRYVDDLYWSTLWGSTPDERIGVERGQAFHLLASRYYSGAIPAVWTDEIDRPELASWLSLLQDFLPYDPAQAAFYPEHEVRLTRPQDDLRLMAKYDLLVVDQAGRATIYDWKTERRFPRPNYLLNSLQTVVYRYLAVAAAGAYSPRGRFAPDEVAIVYWNPGYPERWERFAYSEAQYKRDERLLRQMVTRILQTAPEGFLATPDQRVCRSCEYAPVCHGKRAEMAVREEEEWLFEEGLSWDRLPEIPD